MSDEQNTKILNKDRLLLFICYSVSFYKGNLVSHQPTLPRQGAIGSPTQ